MPRDLHSTPHTTAHTAPHTPAIRRRPDGSIDTAAHLAEGRKARSRFWRAIARRLADGLAWSLGAARAVRLARH